jgi:hypothetical protein
VKTAASLRGSSQGRPRNRAGRQKRAGRPELGAVAQLGERLICIQEVTGSIPVSSTRNRWRTRTAATRRLVTRGPVAQLVRAHP